MIELGFAITQESSLRFVDWSTIREMELRYDRFLGDIEFLVDDMDLSARWGWIPVFDFALSMRMIADDLADGGREVFDFTESDAVIVFTSQSGRVHINADYADGSGSVSVAEFRQAAEQLLTRVRSQIESGRPDLSRE